MSKPTCDDLFSFKGRRDAESFMRANFALSGMVLVGLFVAWLPLELPTTSVFEVILGFTIFCIILVGVAVSTFALAAQRLHDIGLTGWISLLYFMPFGIALGLWLCIAVGDKGRNAFGPDPLDDTSSDIVTEKPRGGVIHRG